MTRIVDFSAGFAGRYATRLLADYGWEVVAVEVPRNGDTHEMLRARSLQSVDVDSLAYHLGRNKSHLTIDFGDASKREDIARVVGEADFVVADFSKKVALQVGLDVKAIEVLNPGVSFLTVTPFGYATPEGERAVTEKTLYAEGGGMLVAGERAEGDARKPPLMFNIPVLSTMGGIYGALVILAQNLENRRRGANRFHHIDMALRDLMPANLEKIMTFYSYLNAVPFPGARRDRLDQFAGVGDFAAKDGYFHTFAVYKAFENLAALIERPDLAADPTWTNPKQRKLTAAQVDRVMEEGIAQFTLEQLSAKSQQLGLPSGPIVEINQLIDVPQLEHRGALAVLDGGTIDIEEPYRFANQTRCRVPPIRLNVEGLPRKQVPVTRPISSFEPKRGGGPLSGIRVLDLTQAYAGPSATRLLGELGADVIKIESAKRLDIYPRGLIPYDNNPAGDWWERSGYFAERNFNKKGIALDLSRPEGREVFAQLVQKVDVVTSNFTPRVMRGWGFGPAELLKMKPELVVLSMSGFGGTGPDSERPAMAGLIEASSGFTSVIRFADGLKPVDVGYSFGDMVSGLMAALSVLIALDNRDRSGKGDAIDLSCCEAPLPFLAWQLSGWARDGNTPSVTKDIVAGGSHILIRTVGESEGSERWVVAFVPNRRQDDFCSILGLPECRTTVDSKMTQRVVVDALRQSGFATAPLLDSEQLHFDSDYRDRQLFDLVDRAGLDVLPHARAFAALRDGIPMGVKLFRAPRFGEHTDEVLRDLLGLQEAGRKHLLELGITDRIIPMPLPRSLTEPLPLETLEQLGRIRRVPQAKARLRRVFGTPA